MKTILVRYKTSPAQAAANETLVHAVFDALRAASPKGVRYATHRLADGVTFIHIATLDSAGETTLTTLPAFKAFQERLKERCVEPPVLTELSVVDSYESVS